MPARGCPGSELATATAHSGRRREANNQYGPDEKSGRFYFKPGAERALTLDKNSKYRVIEQQGDWVRVQVYGKPGWVRTRNLAEQPTLFPAREEPARIGQKPQRGRGTQSPLSDETLATRREATTLDRVHATMLLQAAGRANALRMLLKREQEREPDFLRLASALSALYPKDSEEKRLLNAMLLAVPS